MITEQDVLDLLKEGKSHEAVQLILKGVGEGADFHECNVVFSHILTINFPWPVVFKLVPQMRNHLFSSGWLNSLVQGRPVNVLSKPIPWITYAAIDFLDSIAKPDWNVFEWGSGNSTLWWSGKVKSVLAAESDKGWHAEISQRMPTNAGIVYGGTVQEYLDVFNNAPVDKFDAIVIDGEFRAACAKIACNKLAPGGIIVFDNSDMSELDEGLQFLTDKGLLRLDFWGLTPGTLYKNCTSVFLTDGAMLKNRKIPSLHQSSVGPSCQQVMDAEARAAGNKAASAPSA
jgi:hypothetical protein